MSDFHTNLFVIALMSIIAVVTWCQWQKTKNKKNRQPVFSQSEEMMNISFKSQEPGLTQPALPREAHALSAIDPLFEKVSMPKRSLSNMAVSAWIDPMLDCTFLIVLNTPLSGEKCLSVLKTFHHIGDLPVRFAGDSGDDWEELVPEKSYLQCLVAVQMANRRRFLNGIAFSHVLTQCRQLATQLDGEVDVFDLPEMPHVVKNAQRLHQFILQHDVQLSLNIKTKTTPWALNTLMLSLRGQGFEFKKTGLWIMPDDYRGVLFSLIINALVQGNHSGGVVDHLTLVVDIARLPASMDAFGAMLRCAKTLATHWDGMIVDDSGQPLAESQFSQITAQVDAFYQGMMASNLAAGHPRVLRLFDEQK